MQNAELFYEDELITATPPGTSTAHFLTIKEQEI
jgi:hypothetical protein